MPMASSSIYCALCRILASVGVTFDLIHNRHKATPRCFIVTIWPVTCAATPENWTTQTATVLLTHSYSPPPPRPMTRMHQENNSMHNVITESVGLCRLPSLESERDRVPIKRFLFKSNHTNVNSTDKILKEMDWMNEDVQWGDWRVASEKGWGSLTHIGLSEHGYVFHYFLKVFG